MDFKKSVIGIELGSTRIKAVLLDESYSPVASGSFTWENKLKDGVWTYDKKDIDDGIRACFADLKKNVKETFGETLREVGAIGISGMMHGYLALDGNLELIADFRTWRNTITSTEAEELTNLFGFNIPDRWSIAHLYKSIIDKEEHLCELDYLTTLAGYIHTKLTGERVLGICDASGMFPINAKTKAFDTAMIAKFEALVKTKGADIKLSDILPRVLTAGEAAGALTAEGAAFLDPEGDLAPGIPLAAPEGDAGTGMVATNAVKLGSGNVSCGTSDFAMLVTDKKLSLHREIDIVSTPDGSCVAMIHCNNCTSDINAWCGLFGEFASLIGCDMSQGELFTTLFRAALSGDPDGGGLLSYNYLSGEGITGFDEGRPLFLRAPNANFNLPTFMRVHLMSALATLKIGMRTLDKEGVKLETITGHGGYFKTEGVGARILSAALGCPVLTMKTAGEGGPFGMALLAAFMLKRAEYDNLPDFLDRAIFSTAEISETLADEEERLGFDLFTRRYEAGLEIERAAVNKTGG